MPKAIDLTNQIFGDYKVLSKVPSKNGKTYWLCECQKCQQTKEIQTSHLRRGEANNCSCGTGIPKYSERTCILCQSTFIPNNRHRKYCYQCSPAGADAATTQRLKKRALKHYLITVKGGKCECCGYNKCEGALQFHHRDPSLKEFNFSHINLNDDNFSLEKLLQELEKCDLLCANCHFEKHYGKE